MRSSPDWRNTGVPDDGGAIVNWIGRGPLTLAALVTAAGCRPESEPPLVTPPGLDQAEASAIATIAPADPHDPYDIVVDGARIEIGYEGRELPVDEVAIAGWVRRTAEMISGYLGGFPVPGLEITVVGRGGGGVSFGLHQDGRWITVYCGRRLTEPKLENDWVMVHEMLHAAFPDLSRDHRWMQEGMSTYLEPIVRAHVGNTTDKEVWKRWTRSMHHGRPKSGDRGLDNTHTWGRTYWGGALFWMMVDVELRTRTDNAKSIRDVVRGILAEGGNGRANWSTQRVVEVGDAATGTTVLSELYASMAQAPGDVDLDELYAELGVQRIDGEVLFDDDAPLAHVRRAITRP